MNRRSRRRFRSRSQQALQPLIASLPAGYRIEMGGNIEEAAKANDGAGPRLSRS